MVVLTVVVFPKKKSADRRADVYGIYLGEPKRSITCTFLYTAGDHRDPPRVREYLSAQQVEDRRWSCGVCRATPPVKTVLCFIQRKIIKARPSPHLLRHIRSLLWVFGSEFSSTCQRENIKARPSLHPDISGVLFGALVLISASSSDHQPS